MRSGHGRLVVVFQRVFQLAFFFTGEAHIVQCIRIARVKLKRFLQHQVSFRSAVFGEQADGLAVHLIDFQGAFPGASGNFGDRLSFGLFGS